MFIDSIRKASETLWFRAFLLVLTLGLCFLWSRREVISPSLRIARDIVSVGNEKIDTRQFAQALYQEAGRLQHHLHQDLTEAQQKQLFPYVLESLITKKLIELEAHRLNLRIGDDQLRQIISEDPAFKNNGIFDSKKFNTILKNAQLRESDYTDSLRRDLLRQELIQSLFGNVKVPKMMVQTLYRYDRQRRIVDVVTIDKTSLTLDKEPSLSVIKEFFQQNPAAFIAPEYRDITALVLDGTALDPQKLQISEEDVKKIFEQKSSELTGQSPKQAQDQIRLNLRKALINRELAALKQDIDDDIGGGSSLEEIAKKLKLKLKTFKMIDAKGDHKLLKDDADIQVSFPADSLEMTIIQEAFKEKKGDISKIIEKGEEQFFIFKVNQVYPAYPQTFEESQTRAKELVIQDWKKEKAKELSLTLQNQVNQGVPLTLLAGQNNLKVTQIRLGRQGPLVPTSFYLPENFINIMFQVPIKKAYATTYLTETNQQIFIVGAVVQIENNQEAIPPHTLTDVEKNIQQNVFNSLYDQYLKSLQKRFPIEKNQKVIDQTFGK